MPGEGSEIERRNVRIDPAQAIDASQVTKPIQLLAAWLIGLIALNGSFLGAAATIREPTWITELLAIAAVVNVPLFLACLFLLQTKFRPEIQEDAYYFRHLERKYSAQSKKETVIDTVTQRAVAQASPPSPELISRHSARPSRYLSVNDLLPNFQEIIRKLEDVGIRPSDTFGSTSTDSDIPTKLVVSIGVKTPTTFARRILDIMKDLGMDGVGVGDEEADADRIYVGAYAYENNNFLPVKSSDYDKLVNDQTTDRTFFRLLRKYEHADGSDDA